MAAITYDRYPSVTTANDSTRVLGSYANDMTPRNPDGSVASMTFNDPPPAPSANYATDWGGGNTAQQQQQLLDALNSPAPAGFDATKWADPTLGTSNKYTAGRITAASGGVNDVLAQPQFKGWTQVGPDKIKSPTGNVYDLYKDYGGPNQQVQYTLVAGPGLDASGNGLGINQWGLRNEDYAALLKDGIPGNYEAARRGQPYQTLQGWVYPPGTKPPASASPITMNQASSYPAASAPAGSPGSIKTSYTAQFSDPATAQFEQYLTTQMQALEAQRAAQAKANADLMAQQAQAKQSADQLIQYLTQRASQLQQAPYTGAEQEILRTQALEPIERDRAAANKRALEQIGARGFDPTSGLALQMQNEVNRGFDQQRAQAQGDLAYRTINEQRSRQQEAQQLLSMIPQVQSGNAQQQLQFLQQLDAATNAPRDKGLALSQMLYRLPAQAQTDALAAMGMGPNTDSLFNQAMSLYNTQLQQQNQGMGYYQMLGAILPYLMSGGNS